MQVRKRQMLLKLTGLLGFAGAAILAVPAFTQTNFMQRVVAQTTPGVGQPTDPTAPGTTTTPGLGTDPTAPGTTTTPDATSPGLGTDPTAPGTTTTPDATSPDTTTPGVGAPTDTDIDNDNDNDLDDNGAAGTTQPEGEGVRALW